MTTAYSTLMGLALPVQGELSGTWGDTVNKGITDYVDIALAGTQTISGSQTAVTLSLTNGDASATNIAQAGSGATGTAQFAIINCTGNPAGLLTVTVPASSRQYVVINATSTSQSVKIVGAGPTTGVTIVSGEKAHIAWNGSDYVKVSSSLGSGDVVGPASATDNAIVRFDGTTGKLVQNSAVTVADTTGDITGGKYNKVTITAPATGSTLTIADGKTLTANNSLTLAGTDGKTLTTNASLTLAGVDGKTLTTNNSLTLAGTDGTTMTFPSASASVGYLNIPAVADKTSAYTLAVGDVGKVVGVGTGGSIEIPNSTFAAGDAVLIFNNTSSGITITCTITTAYIAGTDADKATVTLATRGLANILFISGTACVITGNVS